MEVTRILSEFLVSSRYEDLPPEVRHEASRAMVNALGCAIGAARHDTVDHALAAVSAFAGSRHASVWGRSERLDALNASLVNGIATHVLDFDDTHQRTVHTTAPVLPALLEYAEWQSTLAGNDGFKGKDLAFVRPAGGRVSQAERCVPLRPVCG